MYPNDDIGFCFFCERASTKNMNVCSICKAELCDSCLSDELGIYEDLSCKKCYKSCNICHLNNNSSDHDTDPCSICDLPTCSTLMCLDDAECIVCEECFEMSKCYTCNIPVCSVCSDKHTVYDCRINIMTRCRDCKPDIPCELHRYCPECNEFTTSGGWCNTCFMIVALPLWRLERDYNVKFMSHIVIDFLGAKRKLPCDKLENVNKKKMC
jgi:hypothetical protein